MLSYIFHIIAPVFLIVGFGYIVAKAGTISDAMIDGLMKFAIQLAVPCLLFLATSRLDLGNDFDWRFFLAYYAGSTTTFLLAIVLIWKVFKRTPGEAVAAGFGALFSNLVLLGLPISERAWGTENMAANYAIVSIHAPFCYLLGISTMEWLRADGRSLGKTAGVIAAAMFRNTLMIGIAAGFVVNLSGLPVPGILTAALEMMAKSALPVALFAMGGILTRYSLKQQGRGEIYTITTLSLIIHPAIAFGICLLLGLPDAITRSVVLMASMAPGINAYIFASMYERSQGVAASTVLFATATSILSVSAWLWALSP